MARQRLRTDDSAPHTESLQPVTYGPVTQLAPVGQGVMTRPGQHIRRRAICWSHLGLVGITSAPDLGVQWFRQRWAHLIDAH
jgi:hypothetical protein